MARAGEEGHEEHNASRRQKNPPRQAFFRLYDEEVAEGGVRPGSVTDPRPQERLQRHTVEHVVDFVRFAPMVQILGTPVPQILERLPDIMHFFDTLTPGPEQVIEVPKILPDDVPMRTAVRDMQLAEQLVEVPTEPGYALAVIALKVFSRRELRGSLSGQGSTASGSGFSEQVVDNPVPQGRRGRGGGLQGSRARQNSTAADVEQIVDIPARGGLQGFLPGQGSTTSSSSRLLADADEGIHVVFRTFPRPPKSAEVTRQSSARVSASLLRRSLMSPGRMRLATPCPLLTRPHGGCGGGGWGRRLRRRRRGCNRLLWWASLCSSATSSSSLRVRVEGASVSVHPGLAGPFQLCYRDACPQCKLCRNTVPVQFLGAVDMPVVVQRQAPGSSQCKQLWSRTVAVLWRLERRQGKLQLLSGQG